jgi:hypothetical protein
VPNRKRYPSPDDLLRALVEAKQRFGCRQLEVIDTKALADTGGQEKTNKKLEALLKK